MDLRYGSNGDNVAPPEDVELRELTALADDVHRTLRTDSAYAQSAARARFVEFLNSQARPAPRHRPVLAWRRQPAAALILAVLLAMAIAAWAYVLLAPQPSSCPAPNMGQPTSSPATITPSTPQPSKRGACAPAPHKA